MAPAKFGANRYAALFSEDEDEEKIGIEDVVKPSAKGCLKKRKKKKNEAKQVQAVDVVETSNPERSAKKRKRSEERIGTESIDAGETEEPKIELSGEKCTRDARAEIPVKPVEEEGLLPLGATRTLQGGVTIKVTRAAPDGATVATKGCELKVLYEGSLPMKNGRNFDSGEIDFMLGDGTMLQGFVIGVKGMGVGERRIIHIPWRLGYGKKGKKPKIPPRSDLDFDVTLTFCGVDWLRRTSNNFEDKKSAMSNKRREAAKRRGKKPKTT